MIEITPFDINSNGYQPDFYVHGNLVQDSNGVCVLDDTFRDRIYTHFYRKEPLPMTIISIPDGMHLCSYKNTLCALFTWKVVVHTDDGIISDSVHCYNFDTWVKQNGLIVDINDTEAIKDALHKYAHKTFMI